MGTLVWGGEFKPADGWKPLPKYAWLNIHAKFPMTTPDQRLRRAQLSVLNPLQFYVIEGLTSSSQINGQHCLCLGAPRPNGRIPVQTVAKTCLVKPANLFEIRDCAYCRICTRVHRQHYGDPQPLLDGLDCRYSDNGWHRLDNLPMRGVYINDDGHLCSAPSH